MKKNDILKSSIAILEELISFDTTSKLSNLELINHITSYLDNLGVVSRLTHDNEKNKANLWATLDPLDKSPSKNHTANRGGIVLSGHLDVVPVDGQAWSNDPFRLIQKDGKLFGRGSVDMKGFVAVCLAMAPVFLRKQLQLPIHFAFTYDEEVGCIGVHGLIDDIVKHLPIPRAVIVGEPTSMKIIGGHKGSRSYRTTIKGVPAHSSDPRQGVNSIMAAAHLVTFLESLQQELFSSPDTNHAFDPPCSTVDLGTITGGTANNIIPEYTTIEWGFRLLPTENANALQQKVFDHIENHLLPELQKQSTDATITTELTNEMVPLLPDQQSPAEQLIRHLTGLNESGVVSFGTEAGTYQKADIPAVVFGPGSITQAHQPDEFIEISQLEACVDFMFQLAEWAEQWTEKNDGFSLT